MAMSGDYLDVYSGYRSHDNYKELFPSIFKLLSSEVNLGSVKSCLIVGPGDGVHEVMFINTCVPGTSRIIALEPDHESAERFRARLESSLPDVARQVVETSIQGWKGPDYQVDLVLMMLVLYYVSPSERKELFKKLHEQWLAKDGRVVIVSSSRTKSPGNANEIFARLGTPLLAWEDIEADMLEAGFVKQFAREMQFTRDFTKLDQSFLRFYQYHIDQPVTLDDVRRVITELFPDGQSDQLFYMMAVFHKA